MTWKWRKIWLRRKKKAFFRSLWVRFPLSLVTRSVFTSQSGHSNSRSKTRSTSNLTFDAGQFVFEQFEHNWETKASTKSIDVKKQNVKQEYRHFVKLLIKSGFFSAASGTHYSFERYPPMDFGVDYQFKIYWRGGKEPIKTIELSDSLHYGLDEDDRERFGEFEGYLHELVK